MWNEKELMEQLDNYIKNTSKEQFLKDLEETNCLQFLEKVKEQ